MQIIWRTLPRLALPAAIGLGVAYLATGFVPRPAPNLRPPEELRARGQGFAEESPVRTILERNVLGLEGPLFYPQGQPPAPIPVHASRPPAATPAATSVNPPAAAPAQAAFAPVEPVPPVPGSPQQPLSGGHSVVGRIQPPGHPGPGAAPANPAVGSGPAANGQADPAEPPATRAPAPASRPTAAPASGAAPAPRPPAAPAAAPAPAPSLAGVQLVGVIAGGERPLAMLKVDGASQSLGLGGQVRGWTLMAVEPGQVVLRHGERVQRLALGAPKP